MNVLIVEDDRPLAMFMKRALETQNHVCTVVHCGAEAVARASEDPAELCILDLNLPGADGTDVLESVRRLSDHPVIVVTGRAALDERVRCLEMGADDVLVKPFALSELLARVSALARRSERGADKILRAGDLTLNRLTRVVVHCGVAVELTQKEYALLEYLMRNSARCVARTELLEQVWQMTPDTETNVVDVYVNYLRRKLGADVVKTMRGRGYQISTPKKPVMRAELMHGMRFNAKQHLGAQRA